VDRPPLHMWDSQYRKRLPCSGRGPKGGVPGAIGAEMGLPYESAISNTEKVLVPKRRFWALLPKGACPELLGPKWASLMRARFPIPKKPRFRRGLFWVLLPEGACLELLGPKWASLIFQRFPIPKKSWFRKGDFGRKAHVVPYWERCFP
jgi:hypothetical protein